MILIRRGLYFFLMILVCLGILGTGILGYLSVQTAAADSAAHARFIAERYLFISITAAVLFFVVFISVHIRSIRLDRELDKIIELNRFQDFSPEISMKKLGEMGKKITALYYQLNILNEKKSLKISAQSELAAFLVNNVDLPVSVCDVSGTILWASSSFLEKVDRTRTEIIGTSIDSLLVDISVQNINFELGRIHAAIEKTSGKSIVTCYPIHNRHNDIAYTAFVLDKKAVYSEISGKREPRSQSQASRFQKAFGRILTRKDHKA